MKNYSVSLRFHLLRCALVIGCGLCFLVGMAQQPTLKSFGPGEGLPSSHIYRTYQDREGYLWVSTDKGLARFDGYRFEVYSVRDGLPNNEVWGVAEDQKGRVWINTFDRLVYWQDGHIHEFPSPLGEREKTIIQHEIVQDSLHFVFLDLNHEEYYQLDERDSIRRIDLKRIPTRLELPVGQRARGQQWSASARYFRYRDQGLHYKVRTFGLDLPTERDKRYATGPSTLNLGIIQLWHFDTDRADQLLFSNYGALSVRGDTAFPQAWTDLLGRDITPFQITQFTKDRFLISSLQGAVVVDQDLRYREEFAFLEDHVVNHILMDRQGNYWIATNNRLYLLTASATQSTTLSAQDFLNGDEPTTLARDDRGGIWVGTFRGDLYRYEAGRMVYKTSAGAPIRRLLFTQGREILLGGDWGWHLIPPSMLDEQPIPPDQLDRYNWHEIRFPRPPFPASVTSNPMGLKDVIRGTGGELWYTSHRGFFHFDPVEGFQQIDEVRSYHLCRDSEARIWVARTSGLAVFADKKLVDLGLEHPVFTSPINDLEADRDGGLWLATNGLGLYRYEAGQIDTIHEVQDEIINGLVWGRDRELWVLSNRGLGQLRVRKTTPFRYEYRRWSTVHGLASSEVNDLLLVDDKIYAATKEGLSILPQRPTGEHSSQPELRLRSVLINNRAVPLAAEYQLHHWQNNLKLRYVALSFKSLGRLEYDYRLEGIDSTWQRTTALELNYPALAPGDYPLSIRARDIDRGTESDIQRIRFRIQPPWWQTWWFRSLMVLATAGLFLLILGWRTRTVERRAEARNQINQKMAELELRALQAQMNPHFVFNALQAIQDFIFNKSELVANQYLVKFSRLMRLFLESSKESYISLADELELLRLYIDLERMRFGDQFDYDIEVDPDLLSDSIEMPSMILQPFVENAINHGLRYKSEPGHLWVRILREGTLLQCQVEDDGVGRERARLLRERSYKGHKSRGSQLVEERRRILEVVDQSPIDIQITDLKDPDGVGRGTIVNISIRYALN
ncbi:MAG: two-component regulator propeller domain-containing protein [Bacteroidota bacterium]